MKRIRLFLSRIAAFLAAPFKRYPPPPAPRPEPGPVPPESVRVLFGREPEPLLPDIPFSDADARSALRPVPARVARVLRGGGLRPVREYLDAMGLHREFRRRVRAFYSVRPRPWLSPNARAQALRARARAARGRA